MFYVRPSTTSLIAELQAMDNEARQETSADVRESVQDALHILHELSKRRNEVDVSSLLIPDTDGSLRPSTSIVYNDRGGKGVSVPEGSYVAHAMIPPAIASAFALRCVSEEEFESIDDEDIETFHMAEELSTRVKNTLRNYDIAYASNEWVANADDAKATCIHLVITEGGSSGEKLINPDMKQFEESPSLVIYNDGVFSEKDFQGLGNVGLGGKGDTPDSIGRFGLGAFSFYHFTEVSATEFVGCGVLDRFAADGDGCFRWLGPIFGPLPVISPAPIGWYKTHGYKDVSDSM